MSIAPSPAVTVATRPGSMVSPRQTCWRRGLLEEKVRKGRKGQPCSENGVGEHGGGKKRGKRKNNALVSGRLERNVVQRPLEVVRDGEGRVEEDDVVDGRRGGDDDAGNEHGCEDDVTEGQYDEESEVREGIQRREGKREVKAHTRRGRRKHHQSRPSSQQKSGAKSQKSCFRNQCG